MSDFANFAYTSSAVGGFKLGRYSIHSRYEGVVLLNDAHEIFTLFQCSFNGHDLKMSICDIGNDRIVVLFVFQVSSQCSP